MSVRAQDEIVARFEVYSNTSFNASDILGWRREVLAEALDFEHARPFLKPDVTADSWDAVPTEEQLADKAAAYLDFGYGKAIDHRGISADRSVSKLREFAWLLGRDDVVEAMDKAGYAQYGAPKLLAFAVGMDLPVSTDRAFQRMAAGQLCRPACEDGCGR